MKTTTLASLMASPLAVIAAPAWTMVAYNESYPEIHGKAITADSGTFWVNNPTSAAVCPAYDPECPAANTTIISGPVYGNGTTAQNEYWFMGILQSSGQQMRPAGLDNSYGGLPLKYAAVGAAEIGIGVWDAARDSAPGLVLDNSTVETLGTPTIRSKATVRPYTWMACPDVTYPYPASLDQVNLSAPLSISTITYADSDNYPYCVRLEITLVPTTLAAPDFYYCDGCQNRCDGIYGASSCSQPACLEPYCGPYTQ